MNIDRQVNRGVEKETTKLSSTPIDEVELAIEMLKIEFPNELADKTYKQISESINKRYGIRSTEEDVFLVYEPNIMEIEEDLRTHYSAMGLSFSL